MERPLAARSSKFHRIGLDAVVRIV